MNSYMKPNNISPAGCVSQQPGMPAAACGCGGAGCSDCGGQGYIRPRFFAGQLLTEEDLQSLSDYTVAKNRLHNRHLFGEGVVCGLEVNCHPCGDGKVVVRPGYALDCCGNDVVLSCPIELDINAMVRELRINTLGGDDCGDPCAPPKKTDCNEPGEKEWGGTNGKDRPPARRYCLYIRYCEEQTDPVVPYGTDEPCVNPGCEPTRIKEGVRFELRCDEGDEQSNNLFTQIWHCFGDLIGAEKTTSDAALHKELGRNVHRALEEVRTGCIPEFNKCDLERGTGELASEIKAFCSDSSEQNHEKCDRGTALQAVINATLKVASLLARYVLRANSRVGGSPEDFKDSIQNAVKVLGDAVSAIGEAKDILTKLQASYASATVEVTTDVIRMLPQAPTEGRQDYTVVWPQIDIPMLPFLASGVALTPQLLYDANESLEALRDWLLVRLDKSPALTDCTLREEVDCIRWYPTYLTERLDNRVAGSYSDSGEKLLDALLRYFRECLCHAFLPPCLPCDDTAVLLACLKVRDCEVIEICNLERNFVLSPVAVRYWIPPLHWLGELLEKLCCDPIHMHGITQCMPRPHPQELRTLMPWPELLGRAREMLAKHAGITRDEDKQRFMRVISALHDLVCGQPEQVKVRPALS